MDSARALALARMGIDRYVRRTPSGLSADTPGSVYDATADAPSRARAAQPDREADHEVHEPGGAQAASATRAEPCRESMPSGTARAASGRAMSSTPAVAVPSAQGSERPPACVTAQPESGAWDALDSEIAACRACGLCETRTRTVPGVGDRQARWLVVGEAPGQEEDLRGEPFVGRAGKLLDAMLYAVGLDRGNCYIANVLKCRPPANRNPAPEEAARCRPFLDRQIALIAPRLILAVGAVPARYLLDTEVAVGKLRGQVHRLPGTDIPLVVTYHPAYLLRSPLEKRKVWDDLCLARDAVAPT